MRHSTLPLTITATGLLLAGWYAIAMANTRPHIEAVYQTSKPPTYLPGVGFSAGTRLYVLYSDGTIKRDFKKAPEDINFALRKKAPKKWGRWREAGNGFDVSWDSGKRDRLDSKDQLLECKPGQPLTASFEDFISPLGTRHIHLMASGEFRLSNTGQRPAASGSYRFDGYTLQLRYGNGREQSVGACLLGKEAGTLYVNGKKHVRLR